MLHLTALEWINTGTAAVISSATLPPGPSDGTDLIGQDVCIDGATYTVTGIESCRKKHDLNERCPRYGLFVKQQ